MCNETVRVLPDSMTRSIDFRSHCASSFNSNALRFYARHGFERAATLDGLVQDGIDEVLLRKRL